MISVDLSIQNTVVSNYTEIIGKICRKYMNTVKLLPMSMGIISVRYGILEIQKSNPSPKDPTKRSPERHDTCFHNKDNNVRIWQKALHSLTKS